jgi:LAS superfamily LD-carboxypeptidase LdcB
MRNVERKIVKAPKRAYRTTRVYRYRKKRLKLRKKNFAIFIISLILIILAFIIAFKSPKTTVTKTITKEVITAKEKKLKVLNNIDKEISYFDYSALDRYIAYYKKNPTMDLKEVILEVNIGLDHDPYTKTCETPFLNKSYILVNKYYYLPDNYVPNNLEAINKSYAQSDAKLVNYAKDAYEAMAKDASNSDLKLIAMSSYRSYSYQVDLYNRYVKKDGKAAADTYSAQPGYSEHQTGLALDIYNGKTTYTDFASTKEFTWMQDNAYKYGFILRFPENKEKLTGYEYESWHYRYVGKRIATYIHDHNLCFEEYYFTKIKTYN